jgi:hypothetical protein
MKPSEQLKRALSWHKKKRRFTDMNRLFFTANLPANPENPFAAIDVEPRAPIVASD